MCTVATILMQKFLKPLVVSVLRSKMYRTMRLRDVEPAWFDTISSKSLTTSGFMGARSHLGKL